MATKATLNTKATKTENKIPDTKRFITTPKFNRSTKTNFDAKMKKAVKSLASKSQVDNALGISDKSREQIKKIRLLVLVFHKQKKF